MAEQFHADKGTSLLQQTETRYVPEHAANADRGEVKSHGHTFATRKPIVRRHSTLTAVCPNLLLSNDCNPVIFNLRA